MNCALEKVALVWCFKLRTKWMTVNMPSKESAYQTGRSSLYTVCTAIKLNMWSL